MSWLDWAISDPAPDGLCGYSGLNVPCEVAPELRYGVMWHSAAGVWRPPAYKPSDLMRSRGVSWGATVMLNGDVWRHRPRPTFVNYHAGGPAQNIGLDGFEVEGTGPWTAPQKVSILRVSVDTWRYFGWQPIVLGYRTDRTQAAIRAVILGRGRGSLWEHVWISATSCPGGRDDYAWLMAALEAELTKEDDMAKLIQRTENGQATGPVYVTNGVWKWAITKGSILVELREAGLVDGGVKHISNELFDRIRTTHNPAAASDSGLSFDETVAASAEGTKRALKEGTA